MQKKICAVLAAMAVIGLNGCDKVKNTESSVSSSEITETTDISATTEDVTTTTAETVTTFTQVAVSTQKINKKDFYALYEAEYAKLSDGLKISFERDDYSGDGYVTGFKKGSTVTFEIDAASAQHYDLSFSIASAAVNDCHLKPSALRRAASSRISRSTAYSSIRESRLWSLPPLAVIWSWTI